MIWSHICLHIFLFTNLCYSSLKYINQCLGFVFSLKVVFVCFKFQCCHCIYFRRHLKSNHAERKTFIQGSVRSLPSVFVSVETSEPNTDLLTEKRHRHTENSKGKFDGNFSFFSESLLLSTLVPKFLNVNFFNNTLLLLLLLTIYL